MVYERDINKSKSNTIFGCNAQDYSVKPIYYIIEYPWEFPNDALWDIL